MATAKKTTSSNKQPSVPAKNAAKSNELAKVATSTSLSTNVTSLAEEDAGASGMFDRNDLAITRISIIQSNSPQVKKNEGKFIKGAEEGDFLDSVANEVFANGEEDKAKGKIGQGFFFVPVSYRRTDIEWIPRTKGGGYVADHGPSGEILRSCTKDEDTGAMMTKNGNEIVTTAEYLGFAFTEKGEEPKQVCISLAKTQLKKARRVNTLLTTLRVPRQAGGTFNPAPFYSFFKVTSVPEKSKKGESFMGWEFKREGDTLALQNGEEMYTTARGFLQSINEGKVKVAAPDAAGQGHEPEDDDSSL